MNMEFNRHDFYSQNKDTLTAHIARLRKRSKAFVVAELATFVLAVALVVAYTAIDGIDEWPLYAAAVMMAVYVAVRRFDVRNSENIERLYCRRSVYEKELKYLDGDFSVFDDGERYADARHEYTFDMDIFGRQSLFQRLCRAVTSGGADRLASTLSCCALTAERRAEYVGQRNEAIKELAAMEAWRTDFLSLGQRGRIDTEAVKAALDGMKKAKIADFALSPVAFVAAWVAVAGFWLSVMLALFTPVSANLPLWWGVLQFAIVYTMCTSPLRAISKTVGRLHKQLKSCVAIMRLILGLKAKAADNKTLIDALTMGHDDALTSFRELEKILDGLDRRGNVLGMVLFNVMFLSDFFLVRRFLRWKRSYMGSVGAWIEAVAEMDARVSLATFRYNEPTATDAVVIEADAVVYDARGLRHPFLGANAVANDFTLVDHNYYIVTGANMAGKSTFLRSLGINYILALAGAPVFASSLRVSVFALFSSMRTSDDLANGISYFNAELLRLQQLLAVCKRSRHTLIILDEILKGTNSLDKLNGSRMFLEAVATLPVTGVVATHDLELSLMADSYPERFHNYCFEIGLADDITYTYKIASGVARNQNATYLLKRMLDDRVSK